ncbi:D-alanyl-D-alanine carboxypeptidase family protein [Oceanobacillus sp. CAU 1775]
MKVKILGILATVLLMSACMEQVDQKPVPRDENQEHIGKTNDKENNKKPLEIAFELPNAPLQKKDTGDNVENLQVALEKIGYTLPINGEYEEVTTWAITDFQLQNDELSVTGIYDEETKITIEELIKTNETIEAGTGLPPIADPVVTNAGSEVLGNPYEVLAIINKQNALPSDYEPHDLVVPDVAFPFTEDLPKKQLREPAAKALEELFAAAEDAGHQLYAQSGYRSYERQVNLFASYAMAHGEDAANQFSARAGESEHQSGLSMDITSSAVNYLLTTDFGSTPEGQWVKENAAQFGFIIRYPKEKEDITLYQFEPWHLRYVGIKAAEEIAANDWTLEEYLSEEN